MGSVFLSLCVLGLCWLGCRQSYRANNCEFWVDGVAQTKVGYQGWSEAGLHTELKVNKDITDLFDLFQVILYQNSTTNKTTGFSLRASFEQNRQVWVIETVYKTVVPDQRTVWPNMDPQYMTYVMKRRTDKVCLWLSEPTEEAFSLEAVFKPPLYPLQAGRKQMVWANQQVALFDQKRSCAGNVTK